LLFKGLRAVVNRGADTFHSQVLKRPPNGPQRPIHAKEKAAYG